MVINNNNGRNANINGAYLYTALDPLTMGKQTY